MTQPFCRYIQNQIRFVENSVQPCCWIKQQRPVTKIAQFRKELANNTDWNSLCNHCLSMENNGILSPRMRVDQYPELIVGAHRDLDLNHLTSLEFQIDGDCNAACLMCSEINSSTWYKYNRINGIQHASELKKIVDIRVQSTFMNRLTTAMSAVDFSHVKQVAFLGGEPFINDNHLKVLEIIGQHVPIENLNLKYVTNASKMPSQQCLDIWQRAKRVVVAFSVDAIGQRFEHNRWPLQWHQVSTNIKRLVEMNLPNMDFAFSITLTPLTVFYYQEVKQWINQLNEQCPDTPDITIRDSFMHASQGILNLSCVPDKLQQRIVEKYGQDHKVVKLINAFDVHQYEEFMTYLTHHDQKRRLNWRDVYSEIQDCFD
jgi:hypothetical protein